MMNSRLDSAFPELANAFRRASASKRYNATRIACELAIAESRLDADLLSGPLIALRRGEVPASTHREHMEAMAAELDREYLKLASEEDEIKNRESLRFFSKARAASALAFALTGDAEQLDEALYEAIMAFDDPSVLFERVDDALR